jgi:hypothetical protein
VFIAKPPAGSEGNAIQLFSEMKNIPNSSTGLIVQRYLNDPFLIDGLKFDLRVYVVVVGLNPV